MSQNRLNVVPTVSVLAVMKSRLQGATRGHSLLKKKADALTVRFRQILKKIVQTKKEMGKTMREASFALMEAKYSAGEFQHTVFDAVEQATVKVHAQQDNVAGVKIPKFEKTEHSKSDSKMNLTGLGAGGQQVQGTRKAHVQVIELLIDLASLQLACLMAFVKAIELLIDLASLQTAFLTLDAAIKTTNRRVNALDSVVKPRLENTISYIKGELDELEREEFFRLKKVQGKKQRSAELEKIAAKTRKAERDSETGGGQQGSQKGGQNMLDAHEDKDIIF